MDDVLTILTAYGIGFFTPITVNWYTESRRRQRVKAVINAWFNDRDNRAMDYETLIRFIGMNLRDPQLLFQSSLLDVLRQLHHTSTGEPGVQGFLHEDLDEVDQEVKKMLRSQQRWPRLWHSVKQKLFD
ncbi:MAG: hypothetical protein KTV45_14610 [Acidimicrobiia bacterium]|nr:hypothetical protein [Acidimicrobiia bacterium]